MGSLSAEMFKLIVTFLAIASAIDARILNLGDKELQLFESILKDALKEHVKENQIITKSFELDSGEDSDKFTNLRDVDINETHNGE